jgi:hypothetical protein
MSKAIDAKLGILVAGVCLLSAAACGEKAGKPIAARPVPTPQGTPVGAPVGVSIGPQGGTVASADGRLTVRVPPGAIPAATSFSVQQITNPAPGGLGSAYRLEPHGVTFLKPVKFTFIAGWSGAAIDKLTIAFQEAGGFWLHARDVKRDAAAKTLTVATTHFSDWTIVAADPTQDFSGTFSFTSSTDTTDVPFTASGQATMTLAAQDSTERYYILSGTSTIQQPVLSGGNACTVNDNPVYAFPANVAEVFSSPSSFSWGTSARWSTSCGTAAEAFDTAGVSHFRCARSYLASPVITPDALQGSYLIDCGAGATVQASWSFLRCSGTCTSANPCHTAAISCAGANPTCTDTGNVPDGTSCGTDLVCGGGTCNACTSGQACTPANPCHAGSISCTTGFPVCVDTGTNLANGTTCGTGQVCLNGACNACSASQPCSLVPPANECHVGTTDCSTGTQLCVDTLQIRPAGAACTGGVCNGAEVCIACTPGASCSLVAPANECHAGAIDCTTGASVCVDTGQNLAAGSACTGGVCNGAGTCNACTPNVACTPTNPCHNGITNCTTGSLQCTDQGTTVAPGTACGTNAVCDAAGTCNACTAGAACTPANPCHVGAIDCTSGAPVCVDTGTNLPDGTSGTCGANQVCSAGACSPCTSGASCTPANPCHQGSISCTTGTPVCLDGGTNLADGASCGANQVCFAGTCGPCTQGASCTFVNACVATATIECASGVPVCTERTAIADGTSCGTGLACSGGSCIETPCVTGAACIPANPCHAGTATCGPPDACADTAVALADGTSCGTDLVCQAGTCLACPASAGTGCLSTNPCAITAAIQCDAVTGAATCADLTFQPDGTACGTGLTCLAGVCQ